MLSRVAESIYWMNRYIERAENVARFIDVNLTLTLDLHDEGEQGWEPLIRVTGDTPLFEEHYGEYSSDNVIEFLTFDPDNPNSILRSLHQARENARSVREVISSEMWEQLNTAFLEVRAAAFGRRDFVDSPHRFFTRVKMASHLFAGVMDATMSHGEAWHFGRLGRCIERADKTSRILDVKYFMLLPDVSYVGSAYDNIQWAAVLRSTSALEMYRKRHGRIAPGRVAEFLILEREFPRAIRHCLADAEFSLHAISGAPAGTFQNPAEQLLGRVRAELDYTQIEEIMQSGLHEYLDGLQARLNTVGDMISQTFFAAGPAGQLQVSA